LAVAEHGTFTYAAAALNVAQPSLSQAIQSLERELGVKLFERVKNGARLTSAGEALVNPARRTLRDFDEALAAVRNVEGLRSGRLVVVAPPHLAADPLAQLLGTFHERYPEVAIRIVDHSGSDVLGVLRSGGADVGLDSSAPDDPGVNVSRLAEEEVLIVLPPGTQGFGPVVPVSALDDVDLVSALVPSHMAPRRRMRAAGITSRILVETAHYVAAVPLVLAGLGATLATRPLARQAVALGAVACRLDPPLYREAFLVHLPTSTSFAGRAFLEIVAEVEASQPHGDSAGSSSDGALGATR
jgi:LysR family carnitine catabolism transcriptional activator